MLTPLVMLTITIIVIALAIHAQWTGRDGQYNPNSYAKKHGKDNCDISNE